MITIMSNDEYQESHSLRAIEESKLVFVYNQEKNSYSLEKNVFGHTAKDLSSGKMLDLIKSVVKNP